jgi:hypothetical protein
LIDIVGSLAAPMQHNDERRPLAQPMRDELQHAKMARITAEGSDFRKSLRL